MRTLVAAVAFAFLVVAVFVWLLLSHAGDAAGARDPAGASGTARMGALEADTNRLGRDLSDIGLKVPDAAACSRLCAIDERCLAMSFVKGGDAGAGLCWLKGSVPGASENPAVVSAVKVPADH
jgi:PAN domain